MKAVNVHVERNVKLIQFQTMPIQVNDEEKNNVEIIKCKQCHAANMTGPIAVFVNLPSDIINDQNMCRAGSSSTPHTLHL